MAKKLAFQKAAAAKRKNPALERLEEKQGKDLDGDDEKGESASHRKKVMGGGKTPPAMKQGGKMVPMNGKKSKPSSGTGDKACPACIKSGASSCSHM